MKTKLKGRGIVNLAAVSCKEAPRAYGSKADAKGNNISAPVEFK